MDITHARLTAFGNQLVSVHLWLREELTALREELESREADGDRPRELRAHCLAFCSALTRHHTGEEEGAFPELEKELPELRPIIEELRRDHGLIDEALHRLEAMLNQPGRERDSLQREIDGIAALMETHFRYEEKRIVSALNALTVPDWDRAKPDFLLAEDG